MPRDPLDRYYTPDALAEACLRFNAERLWTRPASTLEPCAGGGAFGRAALRLWPSVVVQGCDPDTAAAPGYPVDRCLVEDWTPPPAEAIFTNPHYANVYETVRVLRALQERTNARVLGLLLRATTLEHLMASDDRPQEVAISRQRPRWGGPGGADLTSSDTCGSVWALWYHPQPRGYSATNLYHLPDWRPRGRT
jgi:hypothetical protein